jgi:hypothetical protein
MFLDIEIQLYIIHTFTDNNVFPYKDKTIKHLSTELYLSDLKPSPYRAVNTLHRLYKPVS